ncbi:nitrate/nitrite two-component system sensor histidine kinase NarQ [Shewanella marina]|uniref:nitrate/nitrite two-component system sensor histidine kinase NarQ n=1 Tax=Shewanella marina TaxID=487319 RepID=UPI00046F3267|nr:nitrate/nitrite two-component system sensor histidine kinase NarQ [Shewanella marina]
MCKKGHKTSLTTTILGLMLVLVMLSTGLAIFAIINLSYSVGDAKAINASGSLRMQSYRLMFYANSGSDNLEKMIKTFEDTLHSKALIRSMSHSSPQAQTELYQRVVTEWQVRKQYLQERNTRAYAASLKPFVATIDHYVNELEEQAAFKLKLLVVSQIIGLSIMLFITIIAVRYTRTKVVEPLKQLMLSANSISKGNFNIKMPKTDYYELSALTNAIESTAAELSELYDGLELQVKQKTDALIKSKQEIELLYESLLILHSDKLEINSLQNTLDKLQSDLGFSFVELTINHDKQHPINIFAKQNIDTSVSTVKFPLIFNKTQLGYMRIAGSQSQHLALLNNFSIMIARSIVIHQASESRQQLALMEERAVIARELHDSLGQLLTFSKIQISLLNKQLKPLENQKIDDALAELKQGIDSAYSQLRELLATFRLTIDDPNFEVAIGHMLSKLQQQSTAPIHLNFNINGYLLSPHQQVHILHIVREATLNAIKHAQAKQINIQFNNMENNQIEVIISDDGIGIDAVKHKQQHFGLSIMNERTKYLAGTLNIAANQFGGTSIEFHFPINEERLNG